MTLCFPCVPLPLFEVGQTVDPQEGDRAVIFTSIVGVEVDADVPVEIAQGSWSVERLHIG
jgi:hypothetical protein